MTFYALGVAGGQWRGGTDLVVKEGLCFFGIGIESIGPSISITFA